MIRRGLQILIVGITALGAAPSFAQYAGEIPHRVTINASGSFGYSGVYVLTGLVQEAEHSLGGVYQRFVGDQQQPYWLVWRTFPQTDLTRRYNVQFVISNEYPNTFNFDGNFEQVTTVNLSAAVVGPNPSFVFLHWGELLIDWFPPVSDPYSEAFPDWESAAQKIPLGFSMAMAFWGVCVAAAISMKWVRDLASAAS